MGAYFCAYERDVVVAIKMSTYINWMLNNFSMGAVILILRYVYIFMWPLWEFVVGKYYVSGLKPAQAS